MYYWITPKLNEKIWEKYPITHVKVVRGVVADKPKAKDMIRHIRDRADTEGIALIEDVIPGFPAYRDGSMPHRQAVMVELRYMANERTSGRRSENKGLLKLGWKLPDSQEAKVD